MKKLLISFKTSDEALRDFKEAYHRAKTREAKEPHYEISFDNRKDFDRLIDEGKASPPIDGEKAFRQIRSYIARRKKERAAVRITTKKARKKS